MTKSCQEETSCCSKEGTCCDDDKSSDCCSTSMKDKNGRTVDEGRVVLSCWAVVVNERQQVWVWDTAGVLRRFGLATKSINNSSNQQQQLCFASHNTPHVDDLLTPCFDEQGRHGLPAEDCFCGQEDPHLHAHYASQHCCHGNNNNKDKIMSDNNIEQLANLLLLPLAEDEEEQQQVEKEKELSTNEWPCANISHHISRQAVDTLTWRGEPCTLENCTSSYNDNNTPSFRLAGTRAWGVTQEINLTLQVYHSAAGTSQIQTEQASCSSSSKDSSCCSKTPCSTENFNDDQVLARPPCCSSKKDRNDDVATCCERDQETKSCCGSPLQKDSTSCCSQKFDDSGGGDVSTTTTSCQGPSCCSGNANIDCGGGAAGQAKCKTDSKSFECLGKSSSGEGTIVEALENDTIQGTKSVGRSQFYVGGLCCASEVPIIHAILNGTPGIERVDVNPTSKFVFVSHQSECISAKEIATMLNRRGMGAEVRVDAGASLTNQHRQSLFVVSKFKLGTGSSTVTVDENRIDLLLKAYDETKVESFAFNVRDKILIVVHNPWTIEAKDILHALEDVADNQPVEILVDGSDQNRSSLDYAALSASTSTAKEERSSSTSHRSQWPRPAVVLSGLFWIVSMLSYVGDAWEFLSYFALASVAFGLPPIARKAIGTLRQQFRFDANGLMLIASLGALALGEFPEAAAVVFLFALSEWLEQRASSRAHLALAAIVHLRPDKARIIDPETQQLWTVPAVSVPVGALISVKASDKIPCDGIVVEGSSTVDESSLTGESRPIRKGPKDNVFGGTINSGLRQLVVRTTSTADDSAVARLIRLVEEAQLNRSETEKRVDEFAKFYTPILLLSAVLMCTIPWFYGSSTGRKWSKNALVCIVVACPCALIISTPVTYVAGLAASAQKGVLIKGGAFLEALGQVSHICFDKTGTLTTGEFTLLHLDVVGDFLSRFQVLEYLLMMEERAAHPVAQAITTAARNENVTIPKGMVLQKHTILEGEGVTGVINGQDVFVGNERLFQRLGLLSGLPGDSVDCVESWKPLGGTIGFIAVEDRIVGMYCAADAVRPEAAEVVKTLQRRGIALSMLTGDNQEAAQSVGDQLGWHGEKNEIHAKLLPDDKLTFVRELTDPSVRSSKACCSKYVVLFVGDGLNDAPSLAAAHVGVAMGSGAVVAMETAHVTLLDPSLRKLEFAQAMGRRVLVKILENIVFSVSVKAAVLVWAFSGSPSLWAAIGSDVGSMLLVTLNSMLLLPAQGKSTGLPLKEHLEVEKMA